MLTQEQKREVYEMYIDRKNKTADIGKKYSITRGEVVRIAVEMGATPRNELKYGKTINKTAGNAERVCPKCKRKINVTGARFCCFCGSDIRTSKEIAADNLKKLIAHEALLPANLRDEFVQTILTAINELKK